MKKNGPKVSIFYPKSTKNCRYAFCIYLITNAHGLFK